MIRFPCRCGHQFEVSDDQAGGMIQCPKCHLLRDIPTLSDLPGLNQQRKDPLPVYFVGVGEKLADLQTFRAREFAQALLS